MKAMTDAPETIGRYQVRRIIGQGGMGMVLLAWDPLLDREVAIKLLREDDDELRERFAREARSAAKLRHPNVVTIFDVGEHDGRPFIAMEYIEGETLAAIIRDRKPVPTPKRLQYIEGLCDGLSFAHRLGIVHRDVKPANVMVERDGSVKILDFGIARASESVRLTRAGMLIGTLNYMSPEQVMGKSVDHRSDIFAVGLVFYELLAYQKAFPGKVLADLIDKIVKSAPPPLAELRVGLDPEVIHIVEKAMEKDPAARYQDLGSMQKDLERVRRRLETADEPTQPMRVPVEFLKPPSQQKADQAAKETAWQKAEAERLAEERRKEEERKKAEAARRAEAERLAEERRKEEEQKKAEAARRAEAERLAEERRKEEERQAEIRREEAAARAKRIAEGVAEARAAMGREEFDAAATSLDALERADGAAPEIAEAREEVRAARAAAEAARVRAAVEAELARGRAALTAGDFATAEAAAAAAVKLDGRHAEAQAFQRAVKDAIRREEAQRKAAEKEARRKQKEIASLLKKGTRTRSHAEAIASLERLLKLEPENKDAERLLENRRQALKDVEAEAARRVAQGLPPVPPSQAQVLLAKAATGVRGAAGSLQRFALGSLRPAVANVGRKVASWRAPQWGIAGAAAVILLAAALWFSRSVEPPSVESALPPLQPLSAVPGALTGVPIPLPAPGGERETVRAQSDAETAGAAREQAGEPQLPTEIPASQVALAAAARWEAMLQEATSLYDDGDRAGALETAGAILAESPRYQPLFELLGRMQRDGYDETRQARLAADAFGERVEKLQSYYDGAVAEDLASQANRSGEFFEAIRQYWRATDAFERATDEARKLPPEPTVDLEPVMAVVREYGRALQQLDANAVQRVFPDVDMRALRDEFRGIVTQQVTIRDPRAVAVADTSVAIRCEITRVVRRRNTSVEEITAPVELNLALRDGRWVIVARR